VFLRVQTCSDQNACNWRYGPTACTLVGRENEAEDIDTLPLGVQWTGPGVKAVSEVSDFGHICVHRIEVVGLATGPAEGYGQRRPVAVERPAFPDHREPHRRPSW
jgi:hypothetical protein